LAAPDESRSPIPAARPPSDPSTVAFDIRGRIERTDIPALCERARVLLDTAGADRLDCDVGAILAPDAVTVDALARLQLTARRLGRHVRIEHASAELRELFAFMGLSGVVPLGAGSGLEAGRQTEHREELGGIEEEADAADPTA
jgi:ABC-type transporter Mla MlaB component